MLVIQFYSELGSFQNSKKWRITISIKIRIKKIPVTEKIQKSVRSGSWSGSLKIENFTKKIYCQNYTRSGQKVYYSSVAFHGLFRARSTSKTSIKSKTIMGIHGELFLCFAIMLRERGKFFFPILVYVKSRNIRNGFGLSCTGGYNCFIRFCLYSTGSESFFLLSLSQSAFEKWGKKRFWPLDIQAKRD